MRLHHLFAWAAFALIVGLATWRSLASEFTARKAPGVYLVAAGVASVLVMAAGDLCVGRPGGSFLRIS